MKTKLILLLSAVITLGSLSSCVAPYGAGYGYGNNYYRSGYVGSGLYTNYYSRPGYAYSGYRSPYHNRPGFTGYRPTVGYRPHVGGYRGGGFTRVGGFSHPGGFHGHHR
ncbi:hypothetical protein [Prosthecobacter sp.]|uniref:hypothetical protein n=1 Tax=Prosthecobacter sp. TaxID=1965333 RepID=UPI002488181B|nr:hypothetical protein [Prosthecobacter sp.]MDI1315369.1 hypothetical protein [Prosthecobacter sp.]